MGESLLPPKKSNDNKETPTKESEVFTLTIFFSENDRNTLKLPDLGFAWDAIRVVEKGGWKYILVNKEGEVVQYAM